MGKKKKVDINGAPLQSVTIGEIKKSKFGWIGTIILFCIFAGVIYYLPELTKLYEEYTGNNIASGGLPITNTTNNTVESDDENPEDVQQDQYLTFGTDTSYTLDNLTFTNITMRDSILSFSVVNNSQISVSLNALDLYIETYDKNTEDANVLNTIAIKGIVSPNTPLNLTFNVKENASFFIIKEILEEDYTYIDLTPDENNNILLTCQFENEKIIYTFIEDKLKNIEHTVVVPKDDVKYDQKYQEYNTLVARYGSTNGIKTTLSTNMYNMTFNMKIDYNSFKSSIENDFYFAVDTAPRVVNFKMESVLYECS